MLSEILLGGQLLAAEMTNEVLESEVNTLYMSLEVHLCAIGLPAALVWTYV